MQTVFALVLKIAQPKGKIAPGTFKFILSLHFSEKIANLPPTPGVGKAFKVGAIPWFLNWIILKIFEVICTPNFVCMLKWPFSNIFFKTSHENRRFFTIFYVKIILFVYFTHKMAISQFSWARSHYDVIVTSYINGWYLFWHQWQEDVHTYTLVVNLALYDLQYW